MKWESKLKKDGYEKTRIRKQDNVSWAEQWTKKENGKGKRVVFKN